MADGGKALEGEASADNMEASVGSIAEEVMGLGIDSRLERLAAKPVGATTKPFVCVAGELEAIKESEAIEENTRKKDEVFKFWRNIMPESLAKIFTNLSLLGETYAVPDDFSAGSYWEDVAKNNSKLKERGIDVASKLIGHRLNTVKKLKEALEQGEQEVEFDIRAVGGEIFLSHDFNGGVYGEDRNFCKALDFLQSYPTVRIMVDIKEMDAAHLLIGEFDKRGESLRSRCTFMSHNPLVLRFLSEKTGTDRPLVLHYLPMKNANLAVKSSKLFGGEGIEAMLSVTKTFLPGERYTSEVQFSLEDNWEKMKKEFKDTEELYCLWEEFPPDALIEELSNGGTRSIAISIPYNLYFDGIRDWANGVKPKNAFRKLHPVSIQVYGAETLSETAEALRLDADMVVTDAPVNELFHRAA